MTELTFALQPKQREFGESLDKFPVSFFGGARGGGKSHGLRENYLIRRFKYPRSVGAIFRRSYPELEANHITPLFQRHPSLRDYYNDSKKTLYLPNGSMLRFCYCENAKDVLRYQGQEFHDLGIEEAGQWTEAEFRTLQGSNRSSDPNIRASCGLTGNPGGIGHGWLKRLFIDRKFKPNEIPSDYNFIKSLIKDNRALMDNDPGYLSRLNAETSEVLRKAYLDGDWDLMAGQFFNELRREVHLIKPFPIPPHWNRFGSYDFGFNHPAGFGWFAVDEDGNVYLYREFIKAKLRIDQFAKELLKYSDTKELYPIVAGHDCWTKKNVINEQSPPTIAEEFAKYEIYLKRAAIDRIQGASQLRSYLAWQGRSGEPDKKPRFYIFDTCPITYDCLTRMIHDPDNVEDVLKVDATEGDPYTGDDPYDMARYGLMSRPAITDAVKPVIPIGSPKWHQAQAEGIWERERERLEQEESQTIWPDSSNGAFNPYE